MAHILAGLLAILQLLAPALPRQELPQRLRSGQWLRFHVIAQDDTAQMQQAKLVVRDAVQTCYALNRPSDVPMLQAAQALLPELTQAAVSAARAEGFTGNIVVTLGMAAFDDRTLAGTTVPAGEYPALVIRMGDAQGRNWWGLLDPETALLFAAADDSADGAPVWDWSWEALLAALLGRPLPAS